MRSYNMVHRINKKGLAPLGGFIEEALQVALRHAIVVPIRATHEDAAAAADGSQGGNNCAAHADEDDARDARTLARVPEAAAARQHEILQIGVLQPS